MQLRYAVLRALLRAAGIAAFGAAVSIAAAGCTRQASAQTAAPHDPASIAGKHNPEIARLGNVLSAMSDRAKDAIPNGDPEEFLTDLYEVLHKDTDDLLLLCDKRHPVGMDYIPSNIVTLVQNPLYDINRDGLGLRRPAADALSDMGRAAKAAGVTLLVSSTYRSYDYQRTVYNRLVKQDGQEAADRESARPGTSQHQLGTAVDFGSIDDSFAQTKACAWLNEHAGEYGWSLSFPDGYEQDTGYRWESWHFRYIGPEACRFQKKWFGNIQQYMLEFIDAWKKQR